MSRKYANQRDENEKEIRDALVAIGCTVEAIGRPVDLLVGYRARNFLIEVKNPDTRYGKEDRGTKAQREFFKTWQGQVRKVYTVEEAIDVVTKSYRGNRNGR